MPEFQLEKTVYAKRQTVCEIFSNYENYQKLFPQHFPSIRIRSVRGYVSIVEEHMNLGKKELVVMAKHVTNEPISHEIFIIGGDVKGSHIQEQFVEIPEGTKILINVELKLSGKMKLSGLVGKNYKQDYAKIVDDFIKIVEN